MAYPRRYDNLEHEDRHYFFVAKEREGRIAIDLRHLEAIYNYGTTEEWLLEEGYTVIAYEEPEWVKNPRDWYRTRSGKMIKKLRACIRDSIVAFCRVFVRVITAIVCDFDG